MGLFLVQHLPRMMLATQQALAQSNLAAFTLVSECLTFAQKSLADASPVVTGMEQGGWAINRTGLFSGQIINPVPYTLFQFTGTKPHLIEAQKGSALTVNGNLFARVNHPGQSPDAAMLGALQGSISYAQRRLAVFGGRFSVRFGAALTRAKVSIP